MMIFDFDGVIFDSLDEVTLNAYNCVAVTPQILLDDLPGKTAILFKMNRFHVQQIGDALLLMEWCIGNKTEDKLLTKEEYLHIITGQKVPLDNRTESFFAVREVFKAKNEQIWFDLHAPYYPLWNQLKYMDVIILTNKNRSAVAALAENFGLVLKDDNIYSGDRGVTKVENLNEIFDRFGEQNYKFIDDSVKNLIDIDQKVNNPVKKIELFLADWGYLGPDDKEIAKSNGFDIFSQEDLIESLK